ncbi:CheY-like chemotaxis protein [Chryseobacterium sp. PvR013]|uniref:response regulator n=1 Tax=Chryseobacterium sp. PvR013 TaxID=2806595 RepID=UPI001AEB594E|nr:response regulator [Chryseobacterium sp. PvR013]MBP1163491.1 CheY-like chemotaxis protein [Chryseobacterium sp. PvR013]
MRYLLIDDLAERGWKSIIEKAIIKNVGNLDFSVTYDEALNKLNDKYDLIFLDVRLTEDDHKSTEIKNYSGFMLLNEIRKDFLNKNFSTPIILITASNKIWNIDSFRQYGIDEYYIKEHPNFIFNKEFSKQNLENLQKNFLILNEEGKKRKEIWELCTSIIIILENHQYFNTNSKDQNIKQRIIDKLKLGYAQLFSKQTKVEKNILLSNNDSLSFIIFWSILEEVSKAFTDSNMTWYYNRTNRSYEFLGNWIFKNGEKFIENLSEVECKINYVHNNKIQMISYESQYLTGKVNLSDQIYSLIYAYFLVNSNLRNRHLISFSSLNNFRNNIDYIHSSLDNIFSKKLIIQDSNDTYKMNVKILTFVTDILSNEI